MWKCFNRGVWETIDRSVNAFKADTSSGTCLISSLARDLDGVNDDFIKNKSQQFCQDTDETRNPVERKLRRVDHVQNKKLHWAFGFGGHSQASKNHPQEQSNLKSLKGRNCFYVIRKPVVCEEAEERLTGTSLAHEVTHACLDHTVNDKCEAVISTRGKPYLDVDYVSHGNRSEDEKFVYQYDSKKSGSCSKWHSKSCSKKLFMVEGCKGLESSLGLHEAESHEDRFFSPQIPKSALFVGKRVSREKGNPNEKSSPQDLNNSNYKSGCVLRLPFLCYEIGSLKGLSNISVGWFQSSRSDFKNGDNGKSRGDQGGESEESKEDAWRDYQLHQSFLEAVGWSSAVLFGWFLGQYRFRHIHGELIRNGSSEDKKKCCVMRSLTNFLATWKCDSLLPLKALPNKTENVSEEDRKGQHREIHEGEKNSIFDKDDACSANQFTEFNFEDSDVPDSPSSKSHCKFLENEVVLCHQPNLNHKSHDADEKKKNVISMPWHVDSDENVVYGPITLEEAFKEAGKGLEEAQSEVLLALALQKLDEGCSSSLQDDPLPADLFQTSASLGNAAAAFNLGICYEKGIGGAVKNLSQAYHWYKQASDRGHAAATYNLAIFHANGFGGLLPDTKIANELLIKASSLGLEEASNALQLISSASAGGQKYTEVPSSPVEQGSYNHTTEGNSHLIESSKACYSKSGENKQDIGSIYGKDRRICSNDLISGAFSPSFRYFANLSKASSLKFGEVLQNSLVMNFASTSGSLAEEGVFDLHSVRTDHNDSTTVQLLAH